MLHPDKLARIRELSQKKKDGAITETELEERKLLHEEYLKAFRQGMRQHIENIKVVDSEGNDLTSDKVKEIKEARQKFNEQID